MPTASTTATLALGDALAVALMELRGVQEEDFAQNHPGGSLGRQLLTTVGDLMHCGDAVPKVLEDTHFSDVIEEIVEKSIKRGVSKVNKIDKFLSFFK